MLPRGRLSFFPQYTLLLAFPQVSGIITAVGGEGVLRRRLLDMGLTPRTRVMVRKVAPMGDPIEIRLRGYELTIRLEEAAKIQVQPDEKEG